MRLSFSMLFAIYAALEAALMVWFASAFGAASLIWLLLAGLLVGMLVMRIAGISAASALTDVQRRAEAFGVTAADGSEQVVLGAPPGRAEMQQTARAMGRSSLLFVAGLLLAAPGIISDAAGLLLLLPVVRDRIAGRISRSVRATQAQPRVTVVEPDPEPGPGPSASHPPIIISGEILPPEPRQSH